MFIKVKVEHLTSPSTWFYAYGPMTEEQAKTLLPCVKKMHHDPQSKVTASICQDNEVTPEYDKQPLSLLDNTIQTSIFAKERELENLQRMRSCIMKEVKMFIKVTSEHQTVSSTWRFAYGPMSVEQVAILKPFIDKIHTDPERCIHVWESQDSEITDPDYEVRSTDWLKRYIKTELDAMTKEAKYMQDVFLKGLA